MNRNDRKTAGKVRYKQGRSVHSGEKQPSYFASGGGSPAPKNGLPKKYIAAIATLVLAVVATAVYVVTQQPFGKPTGSEVSMIDTIGSGSIDPEADKKYKPNGLGLDPELYKDTILHETDDAGEQYVKESLLVGDSNTLGFYYGNQLTLQNLIGIQGAAIESVAYQPQVYFSGWGNPVSIPAAIKAMQPRRVYINFGTNNLLTVSPDQFVKTYVGALQTIEKQYPYTDIIVTAIVPIGKVRENRAITMQQVDALNKALAEMCKKEGYKFLNISEALKGADGFCKPAYIREDGIHLSQQGREVWLKYLRTHALDTKDRRVNYNPKNIPWQRLPPPPPPSSSSTDDTASKAASDAAASLAASKAASLAASKAASDAAAGNVAAASKAASDAAAAAVAQAASKAASDAAAIAASKAASDAAVAASKAVSDAAAASKPATSSKATSVVSTKPTSLLSQPAGA